MGGSSIVELHIPHRQAFWQEDGEREVRGGDVSDDDILLIYPAAHLKGRRREKKRENVWEPGSKASVDHSNC